MSGLRQTLRTAALQVLALRKLGARPRPGLRFLCYHGVEPSEVPSLEHQLDVVGRMGDFISLDEAIDMMARGTAITSPLFTVTFDDGLMSTCANAWPVFERRGVPFSVFVITGCMDTPGYMGWDDVGRMARSKVGTIGSHTVNHRNLAQLSADEVREELVRSKAQIEAVTGKPCDHFCCPWGRPDRDFLTDRDPAIAEAAGYRSFLTTARGMTHTGDRLPLVRRDVLHMDSSDAELRHFLV
jgi:peptidoglycan/xylan/chitin deacetylase (PgdA/CDA1 family)